MKTNGYKGMVWTTVFASLLCVISIVWISVQSYFIYNESGNGCIVWHEELYPLQCGIFIGRLLFKSMFYALIIVFLITTSPLCFYFQVYYYINTFFFSKNLIITSSTSNSNISKKS